MPYVEVDIENEIDKKKNESPEFKSSWDESREEYRLIGEMISLRKKEKMTQTRLAALTGTKQQVISKIEKREMIPTIRMFSKILNALGYEIKIVKKDMA